ncbi:LamG domain-containing protein [Patescibacteria group bacterium]|nr:LamG domain-containing protein [Patescibacteria group bacterium]
MQTGTNSGDWFTDTSNRDNWTIGVLKYNNQFVNYFNGLIDNVRIYEQALSESQIKQLYVEGAIKHNLALE